jgi:hypothetical protein
MGEFARKLAEAEDKSELEPRRVGFGIPVEQKVAVIPVGSVSPSKARAPGPVMVKCLACGDDLGVEGVAACSSCEQMFHINCVFSSPSSEEGMLATYLCDSCGKGADA